MPADKDEGRSRQDSRDPREHETPFLLEILRAAPVTANAEASLKVTLCVTNSRLEIRGGHAAVVIDRSRAHILAEKGIGKINAERC